ncbi:GerAB/ArcD/ProY family transporter [Paenibacillus pinistramenti]|uniref:GerAB/ArcD/ProY family transporter n=1 Tax=Paenibacillus pinistramenti TaxID=1768003 RepID=UPI001109F1DD|nr:GerAB/ArcD/ProY family transporter [Paenibacillus pinistramenti]
MAKDRYFYYLFLINALLNIVNFVPKGLINGRFDGSMASIMVAVPLGLLFTYLFGKVMGKFPSTGVPEIYNQYLPKPLSLPLLLMFAVLWFIAGLITLLAFVEITLRYISMDVEPLTVLVLFLMVVCISMRINTESILYGLEVLLFLNFPIIGYILFKSLLNPQFNWNAVLEIVTHSAHWPSFGGVATATFVFSGYANLAIFNRVLKNVNFKLLWLLGISGFLVLLTSFLIPIGYLGTINVDRHVYPWFSTADVLRTKNFVIERVLFLFYFNYLMLSLASTILHWHISLNMIKGMFASKKRKKPKRSFDWWVIILFSGFTFAAQTANQFKLDQFGQLFLDVRFGGEGILILSVYLAYRRRKQRQA